MTQNITDRGLAEARVQSEWKISVICTLLSTIGPMSLSIYTPAMPAIATHFGSTTNGVQLSVSLFFAGFAFGQLVAGPLSDGLGRKSVIAGFMLVYIGASLLALLAPSLSWLIAARLLQGIGAAVGTALSRAIVRDLFESRRAVVVQTVIGVGMSVGPTVAPFLGAIIILAAGWGAIFLVLAALGTLALVATLLSLRETVSFDPRRIQPRSVLKSYGMVLREREFLCASLVIGCTNGTIYAQATMMPFILIDQLGYSASAYGIIMLMQAGSFLVGSAFARPLLRFFDARQLTAIGIAMIWLSGCALPLLNAFLSPSLWTIMAPVAIWSAGLAFTFPTMTVVALQAFPQNSGAAAAMLGFIQMGCGMLGGLAAAFFADAATAISIVTPVMGCIALASWWNGQAKISAVGR